MISSISVKALVVFLVASSVAVCSAQQPIGLINAVDEYVQLGPVSRAMSIYIHTSGLRSGEDYCWQLARSASGL